MQRCCVYKLKEGKSLNKIQEVFSDENYVYVEDFARNPLDNEVIYAVYRYIDIETLDWDSKILGLDILPCETFEEYFEFYWDVGQINEKLRELEALNETF